MELFQLLFGEEMELVITYGKLSLVISSLLTVKFYNFNIYIFQQQRLWSLPQDEWHKEAFDQASTSTGK